VMSSASSAVTYTSVYTNSEPRKVFWGADEELSDGGSPRVIVYGYDGLHMQPVAPPSPDYIPGPEEPQTPPVPHGEDELVMSSASSAVAYTSVYTNFEPRRVFWGADEELSDGGSLRVIVYGYNGLPMQPVAPSLPDYIPGPEEPQTPPVPQDEDEREPMFIQPHDPDYVPKPMYPEYIPLKDDHVFPAEEQPLPPVVSPTEDEAEEDEEEEEEHLAPVDSAVVVPTASISLLPEAEVKRLLAMPTPPPSPLISLSPSSAWEHLTRIASTHALVDAVTAALPSPLLPPLPPSLYISPPIDRRDDIPESERLPRKRSCLFSLGSRYEVGKSSTARPTRGRGIDYGFVSTIDAKARRHGIREVGYGIKDTWVDPAKAVPEIAPMTV
ncbi:hypothetical protein Tco_0825550, partial [Tanacetum coccineum]